MDKTGKITTKTVYNCAQYVQVKKTIAALFKIPEYAEILLRTVPESSDGIFETYQDGLNFKMTSRKRNERQENFLLFQLYQDGVGISNLFSANSSIQSSSVFSFSLLNLPRNSSLSTMHLIALCNSLDLKSNDGYNHILGYKTKELEFSVKEGLDVHIPGKGIVKLFGTLSQFTGDNLAINQTFGFTESFSGDYCCIFCFATRHEMQVYSQERDFQMRTIETYEND